MCSLGSVVMQRAFRLLQWGQQRYAGNCHSLPFIVPVAPICRTDCVLQSTARIRSPNAIVARKFATRQTSQSAGIESVVSGVKVRLAGRNINIPFLWLRDHCRCEVCYNCVTSQRNAESCRLTPKLAAAQVQMLDDFLKIRWQDGHVSRYSLQWLSHNFAPVQESVVKQFMWDGKLVRSQTVPSVAYRVYMETEQGLREVLENILKYGFSLVTEVPVIEESVGAVAERICFLLETVFGRLSLLKPDLEHHDTAYTSIAIGAHTDTTYYTLPAGLQLFHCLHHSGEGGETVLVDGFNAAENLRATNPMYFEMLVRTVIPHEYRDKGGVHLYSLGTVLSVDPCTQHLTHIRFNPFDRAPMNTVPAEEVANFYASYEALKQIIWSDDSYFWIKLKPGVVLLVDNWRVLHGRSAFTGDRILSGCYLPRDDWRGVARRLGLL